MYSLASVDNNYTREQIVKAVGQEYSECDINVLKILLIERMKSFKMLKSDDTLNLPQYYNNLLTKNTTTDITTNTKCNTYLKIERNYDYLFGINDISDLLLIDFMSRRKVKWDLLQLEDILALNKKIVDENNDEGKLFDPDSLLIVYPTRLLPNKTAMRAFINGKLGFDHYLTNALKKVNNPKILNSDPIKSLNAYCIYLKEILQKYYPKLIVAGGAVMKALCDYLLLTTGSDIDFFFVNCTVEEVDIILREIWDFLLEKQETDGISIVATRNQNTTTFAYSEDEDANMNEIAETGVKLQFVHRIYPSKDSVIGGFDISAGMVLYDGYEIYATNLGAFSLATQSLIVDVSRRSTSYEFRISKYSGYRFTTIFVKDSNTSILDNMKHTMYVPKQLEIVKGLYVYPSLKYNTFILKDIHNYNSDYNGGEGTDKYLLGVVNMKYAFKGSLEHISWRSNKTTNIFDHPKISFSRKVKKWKEHQYKVALENIQLAQKLANKGITIITKNPWTQERITYNQEQGESVKTDQQNTSVLWTSSYNPIVSNVRDYYLNCSTGFLSIGIPDDVYVLLRSAHRDISNPWSVIPEDLFRTILDIVLESLADHNPVTTIMNMNIMY